MAEAARPITPAILRPGIAGAPPRPGIAGAPLQPGIAGAPGGAVSRVASDGRLTGVHKRDGDGCTGEAR